MNVAILSMQRVLNYGSLLQAYSLKKILEELGHTVSFLDVEVRTSDCCLIMPEEYSHFSEDYYPEREGSRLRMAVSLVKSKAVWLRQKQVFKRFQKDILKLRNDSNDKQYDCCVIGSDEVFNCLQPASYGFTSQLLGNVPQAKKVISYAASCGYTSAEAVPERISGIIRKAFSNISAFSVRDQNTVDFVKTFSDKEVLLHLDPVAVGDFEREMRMRPRKRKLPRHYCIIYAYSGRMNDKASREAIMTLCKKKHLTPIAVGGVHDWIEKHPCLDPFEVLSVFKDADFVVTDTFHGAVFSAKFAKRFAVISRPSNENKLEDLIHRLKIEQHQIHNMDELDRVYSIQKDQVLVDTLLKEERKRTIAFLKENVGAGND